MGSWNETCALSNLAIRPGDQMVWFLYGANTEGWQVFEPTEVYAPYSVPIYGTYADYGRMEPESEAEMELAKLTIKQLRLDASQNLEAFLADLENGSSHFHAKWEKFQDFLAREQPTVIRSGLDQYPNANLFTGKGKHDPNEHQFETKLKPVMAVMFLRSAWEGILSLEVDDLPGRLEHQEKLVKFARNIRGENFGPDEVSKKLSLMLQKTKLSGVLDKFMFGVTDHLTVLEQVAETDADQALVEQIATRIGDLVHMNYIFMSTRQVWPRGSGVGSQNDCHEEVARFHRKLAAISRTESATRRQK